jgi:hypothetical protein
MIMMRLKQRNKDHNDIVAVAIFVVLSVLLVVVFVVIVFVVLILVLVCHAMITTKNCYNRITRRSPRRCNRRSTKSTTPTPATKFFEVSLRLHNNYNNRNNVDFDNDDDNISRFTKDSSSDDEYDVDDNNNDNTDGDSTSMNHHLRPRCDFNRNVMIPMMSPQRTIPIYDKSLSLVINKHSGALFVAVLVNNTNFFMSRAKFWGVLVQVLRSTILVYINSTRPGSL